MTRRDSCAQAPDRPNDGKSDLVRQPRATADTLLEGGLRLRQPVTGYRLNVDALLLAAFARTGRVARLAVDLGAGVGTVGLLLEHAGAAKSIALVERDPELVSIAEHNLSGLGAPGSVYAADLSRTGLPRPLVQQAELVVSNPPFFAPGSGRPRRDAMEAGARTGELEPFLRAAALALTGPKARAAFVYPAPALPTLLAAAETAGLVAKRLRFVHARSAAPARVVLVEFRRAKPGGLVVEPPLVEWIGKNRRSPELAAIVAGRFETASPQRSPHSRSKRMAAAARTLR
jgi:tRNA1(Val) A37 N6-methylase TrmN6